ncbi:unnamed protein product [Cuscuta europaea]|uniref:Zinc finger BED domain-containing protein RICESLEEPER 2-like n=1 Tax=Cuscuta europaea TaxID=41803 RepID=A0A9P1E835_CUSEU|nr:unnamed protein product [Cuscuta europaea]
MADSSCCEDNANIVDFDLTIESMEEDTCVAQKRKQPSASNVGALPPKGPKQKQKKEIAPRSKLHRRIISFKPVCDHKGETIAKQIESCLIDWGIKKVFTVTVDNATANDNTIRILKSNLGFWRDDPLLFDGEFMHVRCCAHILNLIARDGLADISDSVVSVRNAVKYVRSSNARFQAFQKRSDLDKLIRGSLILDNNIRWNYTYLMLTTTLKHRGAFDKMVVEDKLYDGYFLEDEKGKKRVGPPKLNDWENVRRFKIFKNLL